MNLENVRTDLERVATACEEFINKYKNEYADVLRSAEMSEDDSLNQEMMFEIMDHLHGICYDLEYLKKKVVKEGTLSRDSDGNILFEGEELPLMTEMEVCVRDELIGREIWTRTYVGKTVRQFLVGIDRSLKIDGMRVRFKK